MGFELSKPGNQNSSDCTLGFFAEDFPEQLFFAGKRVVFPEIYFRYASARNAFRPEVMRARKAMENNFSGKIGSLDKFVEYGVNWVREELSDLLDFTMEQLALNGCYGLSKDEFYRQYVVEKLHDIPALYDQMEEALDEIHEKQDRTNARRVAERHAKAACGENEFNAMLWNGIKRSGDGILNLTKAAMIYDDEVKSKIKAEFTSLCNTMVDSFAEALYDQANIDLRNPVSIEEFRRTSAMMKNLSADKIPAAKVDEVALEIFCKNPFTPGILDWAVRRYGDEKGELQYIADAFHVDISGTKARILDCTFEEIDFSSEETTLAGKKIFQAAESRLNLHHDEYERKIEDALTDFDRLARTFNQVEYETREMAQKAKTLTQFYEELDFSSEEKSLESQKAFLEKEKELHFTLEPLEQKITDTLKLQNQVALTIDGVEYSSREEALEARRQHEELMSLIDATDFSSEEQIQELIDKIQAAQYKIPFAARILEKLNARLEMVKFLPINNVHWYRLLLLSSVRTTITFGLLILVPVLINVIPVLGYLLLVVCIVWIVSLKFTTRKGLLARAKSFVQIKNYRLAAYCFELIEASKEEILDLNEKQ